MTPATLSITVTTPKMPESIVQCPVTLVPSTMGGAVTFALPLRLLDRKFSAVVLKDSNLRIIKWTAMVYLSHGFICAYTPVYVYISVYVMGKGRF